MICKLNEVERTTYVTHSFKLNVGEKLNKESLFLISFLLKYANYNNEIINKSPW